MTQPKTREKAPADPRSGEPDAGSRGPDVWPFEVPPEQRERVPAEPVRDDSPRDVERPAPPR